MAFLRDGKKMMYAALAVFAASLLVFAYSMMSQQEAEARTLLSRVLVTKTVSSVQDPGAGHEAHQVAMFLPPLADDVVYSGTITWAASGPVELFTYHHYDGPAEKAPPLYTETANGVTYASPLFFVSPDSADHGSLTLAGNAVGFHSLEGSEFTVTATFDGWAKKVALEPYAQGGSASTVIQPTSVDPEAMRYTPLTAGEIGELEQAGWEVVDGKLHKTFQFGSFVDAFQFMYRVGIEAERMNHHPDWTNNYGTVSVYLYSWSAGNQITDYDARLAAVMDRESGQ